MDAGSGSRVGSQVPIICKSNCNLNRRILLPSRKRNGLIMSPCAFPLRRLKYPVLSLLSNFIQAVLLVQRSSNHFFIFGPKLKKSKTFDMYWCPMLSKAFLMSRDKIAAFFPNFFTVFNVL